MLVLEKPIPQSLNTYVQEQLEISLASLLEQQKFVLQKNLSANIRIRPEHDSMHEAHVVIQQGSEIQIVGPASLAFRDIEYTNEFAFFLPGLRIMPTSTNRKENCFTADLKMVIAAIKA